MKNPYKNNWKDILCGIFSLVLSFFSLGVLYYFLSEKITTNTFSGDILIGLILVIITFASFSVSILSFKSRNIPE